MRAAINALHSAERLLATLDHEANELSASVAEIRAERQDAALGARESGDDTKYPSLSAKLEEAKARLEQTASARTAAEARIQAAKTAMHKISCAGHIKQQRRFNNQTFKIATDIALHLQAISDAFQKWNDLSEKLAYAWPVTIAGPLPDGALIFKAEKVAAIGQELMRVSPFDPNRGPVLLGTSWTPFQGDPRSAQSLIDRVVQANEFLLRKIEAVPGATPPAASDLPVIEPDPAPAPDPDASLLEIPAPAQGGNAYEIQASLGPTKVVTIDHRKGSNQ